MRIGLATIISGLVFHASTHAQDWQFSTVATGAKPSLDGDSQGHPHVAYVYEAMSGWIRYAVWNSSTSSFDTSTVNLGSFEGPPSIGVDANDIPNLNYHRHTPPPEQLFAYPSGSSWVNQEITDPNHDGWDNCIAFDSNNLPRTSSIDPSNYAGSTGVEYAYYDGVSWHVEQIGSTLINFHGGTSLAIDGSDDPHITYYDDITDDLMYAVKQGATWSISAIEAAGDAGRFSSLELNAQDQPRVSYYKHLSGDMGVVRFAEWNGSSWVIETVDTLIRVSLNDARTTTSLELDNQGEPHISYGDEKVVKYATRNGSTWQLETVVDFSSVSTNLGQVTSLALGPDDQPQIVYHELVGIGIVKYATRLTTAARLGVIPTDLDFGQVPIGEASTMSVLVQNLGQQTLDVTNVLSDGVNFAILPPTSFSLATLDTHRVYVRFTAPMPEGMYSGTVTFVSNDPLAPTVALAGESVVINDVDGETVFPAQFELLRNFPNPFNPRTEITFAVPVGTRHVVSLQVCDLLGREIATLVNEKLAPGTYTKEWDATGEPSGVYFYRLSTPDFVQTRKLVLLR